MRQAQVTRDFRYGKIRDGIEVTIGGLTFWRECVNATDAETMCEATRINMRLDKGSGGNVTPARNEQQRDPLPACAYDGCRGCGGCMPGPRYSGDPRDGY